MVKVMIETSMAIQIKFTSHTLFNAIPVFRLQEKMAQRKILCPFIW